MNSSVEQKTRAIDLKISKDHLEVFLDDGRIIFVPLEWYPRLAEASKKSLKNFQWIGKGLGIHWSDLDEDLSVEGFLKAQRAPRNQFKARKAILKKAPRKQLTFSR